MTDQTTPTDQTTESTEPAVASDLHLNDAGTHYYVEHTETGAPWECPVSYWPIARATGWKATAVPAVDLSRYFDPGVVDTTKLGDVDERALLAPGTTPGTTSDNGSEQTGFDPDDHDVEGVNAHLAKHAEQAPGEAIRVLTLERTGKARKGVLEGPFGALLEPGVETAPDGPRLSDHQDDGSQPG